MTTTVEAPLPAAAVPAPETADKLTIVLAHGELESVWAALIIASTGAAMGKDTTIFFTFWGLFPLVKEPAPVTGQEWMQKMLAVMNRGGAHHLKLSKLNFAGMGPAMMRHLASEKHVASPEELLEICVDMGVKLMPCQMTMDMMGLKPEDLVDGLLPPVGATTMLLAAENASTFFI